MELNNINQLFERIQQIDNKQGISNFTQTNANYPKNPYTQEVYQAYDLYLDSHKKGFSDTRWLTEDEIQVNNLRVNPDEKNNFIESNLFKNNEYYENIKFYNVEQLDKASFDKLPPEIKPEKQWQENLKIEQFIASQGVKVLHNSTSTPRYNAKTHTIHMPDKSQYDTAEGYYNDVFHEIGHSTCKELGRAPTTPEQAIKFSKRDELVAETSAIKLCELSKVNSNKTNNLTYLKEFLSKFGDDKAIQKMELEKALIESDKVVALTKGKYLDAKKQHGVSNEIFNQALQTASKKLEQRNRSNQKQQFQGMSRGIER
ncbi:zincin-like metallopeptidase domain-containing protein [Gilliamella sp. BG4]|uniref:zincin-like metallopeptidase domain-containing protein n=1 Tax=Gilliamella sp. BG4 TaxID=3351511 RepID=UPI0039859269